MNRRIFLSASAATLLSACAHQQPVKSRFENLTGTAEPLRAQFNDDVGKVRILMLVSPT